jgi:outer membrane protein assembly factor BamB
MRRLILILIALQNIRSGRSGGRDAALLFLKKKNRAAGAAKRLFQSGPKAFETPGASMKEVFAALFSKSGCLLSVANGVLLFCRGLTFLFFAGTAAAQAAPDPKVVWSTPLNVPIYMPPQTLNGRINLTSMQANGPNLFALDAKSGKILWRYNTQGAIGIPPTAGGNQVFVASDIGSTHYLRAIDAKSGTLIWQYTRSNPPECMCSQASILSGNLLFAQSDGHSLYAFAPNGAAPSRRLWQFPGNGAALTSPVVADGRVVFGSGDHNVYALDAKTGAVKWTATTGYIFTATPLVSNGVVVIGDQGGNVSGFDLATGKSLWSNTVGTVDVAAAAKADTAYLVAEDHCVYAFNIKSGQQLWQTCMDDFSQFSPVIAGNLVIVANRAGQLLGLDAQTGKLAWQTKLAGTPFSQPILWPAKNAIVLKLDDHQIGAFDASSGKPLWQYATPLVVTSPAVNDNSVTVATSDGKVVALQ